ncbi:response regulator transcription factor, partial [Thermodesulfobacteriota bacterium]
MGKIILFDKDNYINKQLAQIIQDRLSHVKMKLVSSCEECMTELQVSTPDILMMGANVSDCNCLELIVQIRKMYPGIIIILITDYDIDEYRKDAILKGANHIISREIWTGTEILALINTIIASKTNQAAAACNEVMPLGGLDPTK